MTTVRATTATWKAGTRASSAAALTGCIAYGVYFGVVEADEGTKRAFKAYKTLVPVVVHYRLVEARHKYFSMTIPSDEEKDNYWESLDELYAKPTVAQLAELQGMYCKYCQSAAGFTNTFGPAWITEFRKLENEVPPRPIEEIYQTIREETGKPVHETFSYFETVPLGSASIGQVHKARLKDGGKEVNKNYDLLRCKQVLYENENIMYGCMIVVCTSDLYCSTTKLVTFYVSFRYYHQRWQLRSSTRKHKTCSKKIFIRYVPFVKDLLQNKLSC